MFELPSFFVSTEDTLKKEFEAEFGSPIVVGKEIGMVDHQLTHMKIKNTLYVCTLEVEPKKSNTYTEIRWIYKKDEVPLSSLAQKVFDLPNQAVQLSLFAPKENS